MNDEPLTESLTVGSLFSGIGGLDLGLERAGMQVIWQSEIDPYCTRVLATQWPHVPNLGDVAQIDWNTVEPVDLICGGYPCQPFSSAGKMAGTKDPRHLWPHFANALRVVRPRYALLENVSAHAGLGLSDVLADLAALGFDAEWSVVYAAAMGSPQRRPRLFVVAHRESTERFGRGWLSTVAGDLSVADTHRCRTHIDGPGDAGPWTVEPEMVRLVDGVPPRVVGAPLHALGNAVVPQVAEWIGRRILEAA